MRGIDRHGGEHRQYPVAEYPAGDRALGFGKFPDMRNQCALFRQLCEERVEYPVLGAGQPFDFFPDAHQLLRGAQAARIGFVATVGEALQLRDPNHEKFIEIAGSYGDELQSFQQRIALESGFIQHPAVEVQPREIARKKQSFVV